MSDLYSLLKARLDGAPVLAGKLRDTALDSDGGVFRGNYLLLFMGATPDELVTERATRSPQHDDDAVWDFTLRVVAVDPSGVRLLAQAAFGQLVGWTPTLAGRAFRRVAHEASETVRADTTLKPPLFFADTDYSLRSDRA